jgi:hypothetical protein
MASAGCLVGDAVIGKMVMNSLPSTRAAAAWQSLVGMLN